MRPRTPRSVGPTGLPFGVMPSESAASAIESTSAAMSTSTQCEKSARGRLRETVRPSTLTSVGSVGASGSMHSRAKDRVPAGTPDQRTSGLRLSPMPSRAQKAKVDGIGAPWAKPRTSICSDTANLPFGGGRPETTGPARE